MPIRPYLKGAVFALHDVRAMSLAFQDVCAAFNLTDADEHAREVIATRIIELARRGECDPDRLRERVLKEGNAAAKNTGL